ncbi:carbohydrate ABC transporter permease [Pseudobutyrivibrio sp.]|uniref:carbohydrate ABC transporter permease n=1 Tax=Pseudobutyrivibrio sp. TaxID=2014367 RepID=UPI001E1912E7|nr:sugar ABC transporter permease [Pseudobutyrivibrio sp.]MBE5910609.1 sugar ABC transporter permease [Pseudobutyrivibrio sp.]
MGEFSAKRKIFSFGTMIIGIALMVAGLFMAITLTDFLGIRGELIIAGCILFFVGLYFFPTLKHHRGIINFMFLFPLLFAFVVTVIFPLFIGIGYSFTDWDGITVNKGVGFGNYQRMFGEAQFMWSVLITFLFVIINIILVNLVAFLLALLCTSKLKGLGFFRAAYFVPNLIGGIVLGYIWQFIFSKVITEILNSQASMLVETKTAFIGIVMVYVWQYAGYIMLIYITGLNTVPGDIIEASSIDGANALQTLFKIKIPMIAPTITICTFLTLTSAFKQFDVNLSLTNGTGSVTFMGKYLSKGTSMLAHNIYETAFVNNEYAYGEAKAVFFFIVLAIVSIIQVRVSNKREVEL